jgi:GAF domain-containing protein
VTLSRKGAKSRTRITGLRSKPTKARTPLDRLRAANADLKKKLAEALEQQTATSEVLGVISTSPGELAPVFQATLTNATRICGAKFGALWVAEDDGFRSVATHGLPPALVERQREPLIRPHPQDPLSRLARTKQVVHIADLREEEAYITGYPPLRAVVDDGGGRTLLVVPMLKENSLVGAIAIYTQEVRLFTDKQVELVKNFAGQAVIAIENTRLLHELRQRTDDLSEALEQQTATSEVLRVISTSPGELEPVFQTMLANAVRLCEAKIGTLYIREGDGFRTIATQNAPPAYVEARTRELIRPPPDASLGRVLATKQAVHIFDVKTIPSYLEGNPFVVTPVDLGGYRTTLAVPMLKDPHGQRRHRATRRRQTRSPAAPVATRAPRGAMPPRRREA